MEFGYSRVSTRTQSHDRQVEALLKYGIDEANIEKETASGTKKDREVLSRLLDRLRSGDKLVIVELSRFGRSCKDLLEKIEILSDKGIELISLNERIETHSATGKLMLTMLAALCEFEAALTRERVQEGLAVARANGKRLGRKPTEPKRLETAIKLYKSREVAGYSVRDVARIANVSIATLYREIHKRGLLSE